MDIFDKEKQEEIWRRANPLLRPFPKPPEPQEPEPPPPPVQARSDQEALAADIRRCWRLYWGWSNLLRRCPEGLRGRVLPHTADLKKQLEAFSQRYQALYRAKLEPRGGPPYFTDFWTGLTMVLEDERAADDGSPEARTRMEALEALLFRRG